MLKVYFRPLQPFYRSPDFRLSVFGVFYLVRPYFCVIIPTFSGKYWLWHELWPSQYKPPVYCNGQCALLTANAVEKIYDVAQTTNRNNFRLEDFFYGGILRLKAGIEDPSPVILKKDKLLISACYHMADMANQASLLETFDKYNNGTLLILAGA